MKVRSDWFQILLLAFFNAFYYWLEDQCNKPNWKYNEKQNEPCWRLVL